MLLARDSLTIVWDKNMKLGTVSIASKVLCNSFQNVDKLNRTRLLGKRIFILFHCPHGLYSDKLTQKNISLLRYVLEKVHLLCGMCSDAPNHACITGSFVSCEPICMTFKP
jgi:hypothetical protein